MKTYLATPPLTRFLALILIAAVEVRGWAQGTVAVPEESRINGRWRWSFTMPEGVEVHPTLKLRYDGKTLTGTSRFRHASETPIAMGRFDGHHVSFQVVRQANDKRVVTHYSGAFKDDKIIGKIESNWEGETQAYDWEAKRLADTPEGTWTWERTLGEKDVDVTMKAKLEGEKVTGKVSNRKRGGLDILHGKFKDGRITFELEGKIGAVEFTSKFEGRLVGDRIQGKETIKTDAGATVETWEAVRGE